MGFVTGVTGKTGVFLFLARKETRHRERMCKKEKIYIVFHSPGFPGFSGCGRLP